MILTNRLPVRLGLVLLTLRASIPFAPAEPTAGTQASEVESVLLRFGAALASGDFDKHTRSGWRLVLATTMPRISTSQAQQQ